MNFFGYFQIATIAIFPAVIAAKAIYLRSTTGINPIVIGRGKGVLRVIEPLALSILVLWLIEVVLRAFHSSYDLFPWTVPFAFLQQQATRIVGTVLATGGLVFFLLGFLNFGNSWRIGLDRKTPGSLVTGGIFSVTRNPIYVGVELLFVGIFLINGTWFFLIFALLAILAVHGQILREEEFLRDLYGDSYAAYRARTPRYLFW